MIRPVTHHTAGTLPIANSPLRFSRSEAGITGPPPDVGQDTAAVLSDLLGLGSDEIAELESEGAIATSGGPDISALLA
jgi:crotonobetainyl-CoA:carnitine CoA-transferase CaiB-like acyl-CoA transferase